MKNNKGFTVIELAVSFCIVSAISILLFQLVLSLKDLYLNGTIKTTMLNKQGIMVKKINDDLNDNTLTSIASCGVTCLRFTYSTGDIVDLSVDPYLKTITYGNYTLKLENGSSFGNINTAIYAPGTGTSTKDNSIIKIDIPITNKLVSGDYGIHIVHTYNNDTLNGGASVSNTLSVTGLVLPINGVNIPTKLYTTTIYDSGGNPIGTDDYLYAQVFHHYSNNGANVFTTLDSFLKNTNTDMFSGLFSLDVLSDYYAPDIAATTDVDESKIKSYEFILDYPSISTTLYNNWYQTSNPIKDKISGYQAVKISWPGTTGSFGGLEYNGTEHTGAFIDGSLNSNNYYFAIGEKKASDAGIMGPTAITSTVNLWARVDKYIDQYALSSISY